MSLLRFLFSILVIVKITVLIVDMLMVTSCSQSTARPSLQEELDAGVAFDFHMPSQRRVRVVRAKASHDVSLASEWTSDRPEDGNVLSHICSGMGEIVEILPVSIAVPSAPQHGVFAPRSVDGADPGFAPAPATRGAPQPFDFTRQPLVDYWRSLGFVYDDTAAARVLQVRVMLSPSQHVFVYPADKLFRIVAKPFASPSSGNAPVGESGPEARTVAGAAAGAAAGSVGPTAPGGGVSGTGLLTSGRKRDFPWSDESIVRLRDVIMPASEWVLLGADYSQVW